MNHEISREKWEKCEVCGKSLKDIKSEIGGANTYFSDAFKKHLKMSHNMSMNYYFFNILKLDKVVCACGICNKEVSINTKSSKIVYKQYVCGRYKGTMEWSKRAKESRKGKNNPMFGKETWNKGKTKDDCEQLKRLSESMRDREVSEETKRRQSESAKVRIINGHTGIPHSKETKEFLRKNTLRLIKEGVFKQTLSKPHLMFRSILDSISVDYEEEKTFGYHSFDFYLSELDLYVEIDGDYFHSNPKTYPDGPKTKTQKINEANDRRKNTFMKTSNKKLIRFWECDVLNERDNILCKLKELFLSHRLENKE